MESNRLAELQAMRKTKLIGQAAASLSEEMRRARLDCLIYFHTRLFPWKIRKRGPDGETLEPRVEADGVFDERRLGYPRRWAVQRAIARIHKTCRGESKAYELALRRFKEARRRFLATETKQSWKWYRRGKGNTQNCYFRSWMNRRSGGNGSSASADRVGYFLYRDHELLPREAERQRASCQVTQALKEMEDWREAIFEKMGVPEIFRVLA